MNLLSGLPEWVFHGIYILSFLSLCFAVLLMNRQLDRHNEKLFDLRIEVEELKRKR